MGMSSEAYASQIAALLPAGSLWTALRRGQVFNWLLLALADGFARFHARVDQLYLDVFPPTSSELLPEWEASCGLPDGCLAGGGSIEQRRNAVSARLTSVGGVSRSYFIGVAAKLGFTITVEDIAPAAWRIHAPAETITEMTCNDTCNDALRTWGNEQLECTFNRIKPAHTELLFAYGA